MWWGFVLAAGFTGSFHCALMCGPLVGFRGLTGKDSLPDIIAYQTGRLSSYLALGTIAGLLGHGVFFLGGLANIQHYLLIAMGLWMVFAGLSHYFPTRGRRSKNLVARYLTPLLNGVPREHPAAAGLIGLCSSLLPCGFLYSFVLIAAASASPITGMATMFFFWLGTMPALLAVGLISGASGKRFFGGLYKWTPILMIVLGIWTVAAKWNAGHHESHAGPDPKCVGTIYSFPESIENMPANSIKGRPAFKQKREANATADTGS